MRRIIVLVALLALAATACKIETSIAADIKADGTGTISYEIGFDEEAESLVFGMMPEGQDPFADNPLADFPGATQGEEKRGGMKYYVFSADVDDIAAAINRANQVDENPLIQSFSLTITADRVEVSGRAGAAEAFADTGDMMPIDQLAEAVSANLRLTLPGKILEHNATSKDGNTLTWALPITGGDIEITAVSDPTQSEGGGGFPVWVIIVIAAVLVVGAGAVALRGRRTAVPPPPPPAPEAPIA